MAHEDSDIARFCLATINLERCFSKRPQNSKAEEGAALELFRLIKNTKRRVTKGQLEIAIRVYQDLIRVKYSKGVKTAYCAHRIGDTRHPRGISMFIMKHARNEAAALEAHHNLCLTQKLTRRAIQIHKTMLKHQGAKGGTVAKDEMAMPEDATIFLNHDTTREG